MRWLIRKPQIQPKVQYQALLDHLLTVPTNSSLRAAGNT